MPCTRIFLLLLFSPFFAHVGLSGGDKAGRMPMGVSGVTLGVARLVADALFSDDDDDDGGKEDEGADTVDETQVEQVSPEVALVLNWFENRPLEAVLTDDFRRSLVPALEALEEGRLILFMRRDDEYLIRTLFCIFSFGSEAQRVDLLALLPTLLQPSGENQDLMPHDRSRIRLLMDLLMDKLFSEDQVDRDGARRFALALLEGGFVSLDIFLKAITDCLHYCPSVRWEREPVVWSDLGSFLVDVARHQEAWVQPIVHSVIKKIYFHLDYDDDQNLKHAIEAFLVDLASENPAFKKCVILALFALFVDKDPRALELDPMIPAGTLQWYQVKPIFEMMKAIAGSDGPWVERIVLFAVLLENGKLRCALNECLIQWVREATMPGPVRYRTAMWLANNTGRLFEYGPQSEVVRILLSWAELGDSGWLSLEQRMGICVVAFVDGCSKHRDRAVALVGSLDNSEAVCSVVTDILFRLRAKEAVMASSVYSYRFDLEILMKTLVERDPELMVKIGACM